MDCSKRRLAERLLELMGRVYGQMPSPWSQEWMEMDVTRGQLRTLLLLRGGPQRMSDIAVHLGVSLPSATSMIDRLVSKGFVERAQDPADRRVVTCRLTALGIDEVERLRSFGRVKIQEIAGTLTVAELETVVRGMEILAAGVARLAASGADRPPCGPELQAGPEPADRHAPRARRVAGNGGMP